MQPLFIYLFTYLLMWSSFMSARWAHLVGKQSCHWCEFISVSCCWLSHCRLAPGNLISFTCKHLRKAAYLFVFLAEGSVRGNLHIFSTCLLAEPCKTLLSLKKFCGKIGLFWVTVFKRHVALSVLWGVMVWFFFCYRLKYVASSNLLAFFAVTHKS